MAVTFSVVNVQQEKEHTQTHTHTHTHTHIATVLQHVRRVD
jgi:hypothetical protein